MNLKKRLLIQRLSSLETRMTFLEKVLETLEQNLERSLQDLHMIEDREKLTVLDCLMVEFSESAKAMERARMEKVKLEGELHVA